MSEAGDAPMEEADDPTEGGCTARFVYPPCTTWPGLARVKAMVAERDRDGTLAALDATIRREARERNPPAAAAASMEVVVGDADGTCALHWEGTHLAQLNDALLCQILGPPQLLWALAQAQFVYIPHRPLSEGEEEEDEPMGDDTLADSGDRFEAQTAYDYRVGYGQRYFTPERSDGLRLTKQRKSGGRLSIHGLKRTACDRTMPPHGTPEYARWIRNLGKTANKSMTGGLCYSLAPYSFRIYRSVASPYLGDRRRYPDQISRKRQQGIMTKAWPRHRQLRKLSRYLNQVAELANARIALGVSRLLLWFSDLLLSSYGMHARFYLLPKRFPGSNMSMRQLCSADTYDYVTGGDRSAWCKDWEKRGEWPKKWPLVAMLRFERLGFSFELPQQRYLGYNRAGEKPFPGIPAIGTSYPAEMWALIKAAGRRAATTDVYDATHAAALEYRRRKHWGNRRNEQEWVRALLGILTEPPAPPPDDVPPPSAPPSPPASEAGDVEVEDEAETDARETESGTQPTVGTSGSVGATLSGADPPLVLVRAVEAGPSGLLRYFAPINATGAAPTGPPKDAPMVAEAEEEGPTPPLLWLDDECLRHVFEHLPCAELPLKLACRAMRAAHPEPTRTAVVELVKSLPLFEWAAVSGMHVAHADARAARNHELKLKRKLKRDAVATAAGCVGIKRRHE